MEIIKKHINKVYNWIIILVVIAALALIYVFYKQPKTSNELTEQQKMEILNELSKSSGPSISDEEAQNILKSLSESGQETPLTDEEKAMILDSLSQ